MSRPQLVDDSAPAPHNLEAEKAVLGAVLVNNDHWIDVTEAVSPADFYREPHRLIFLAIGALLDRGQGADLVTVRDTLIQRGELSKVGGAAYVSSLVDGVPRSTNAVYYAGVVRQHGVRRRVIDAAHVMIAEAYRAEDDARLLLDRTEKAILNLAHGEIATDFYPAAELVSEAFGKIERLLSGEGGVTGLSTGFAEVDRMTRGLHPGNLIVLAARPSVGKTAFAANVAHHVASRLQQTVGFFSLEMARDEMIMRQIIAEANVDGHRLMSGTMREADYPKLTASMGVVSECRLFINDQAHVTVLEVRAKARRLKAQYGLALVVIDYLQLMAVPGKENRATELGAVSRGLKQIAKELHVPVLVLSQLNRKTEERGDHKPQISDLRESGAIEQDADAVWLLYRPELYSESPDLVGKAELIIGKQRNGPTGVVHLTWLREQMRFATQEWRQ